MSKLNEFNEEFIELLKKYDASLSISEYYDDPSELYVTIDNKCKFIMQNVYYEDNINCDNILQVQKSHIIMFSDEEK